MGHFQGTTVSGEVINDLAALVTVRAEGHLWNSNVSSGFYFPLFSTYGCSPSNMPFRKYRRTLSPLIAYDHICSDDTTGRSGRCG
jgi:hypothetical protein